MGTHNLAPFRNVPLLAQFIPIKRSIWTQIFALWRKMNPVYGMMNHNLVPPRANGPFPDEQANTMLICGASVPKHPDRALDPPHVDPFKQVVNLSPVDELLELVSWEDGSMCTYLLSM